MRLSLFLVFLAVLVSGCTRPPPSPIITSVPSQKASVVEEAPEPTSEYSVFHTVSTGENLGVIGQRYGVPYQKIAVENGLEPPFLLQIGDQLVIPVESANESEIAQHQTDVVEGGFVQINEPAVSSRPTESVAVTPESPTVLETNPQLDDQPTVSSSGWQRPINSSPSRTEIGTFAKAFFYRLQPGWNIRSVCAGEVLYVGVGLNDYEHMVIVSHTEGYVVSYEFDATPRAATGSQIRGGDTVAVFDGGSRANREMRLEIWRNGRPIDPSALLP